MLDAFVVGKIATVDYVKIRGKGRSEFLVLKVIVYIKANNVLGNRGSGVWFRFCFSLVFHLCSLE